MTCGAKGRGVKYRATALLVCTEVQNQQKQFILGKCTCPPRRKAFVFPEQWNNLGSLAGSLRIGDPCREDATLETLLGLIQGYPMSSASSGCQTELSVSVPWGAWGVRVSAVHLPTSPVLEPMQRNRTLPVTHTGGWATRSKH